MPTICTLVKKRPFDYEGNVEQGVTLRFGSGDTRVSAALFRAILRRFHGEVPGGFDFGAPTSGGLGEWVRDHSGDLNSGHLTPKHGSHIAAILVHERYIRFCIRDNAVWLQFP